MTTDQRVQVFATAALDIFRRQIVFLQEFVTKAAAILATLNPYLGGPKYDAHHPRPLPIDGAAYARRRKARRGRRR